MEKTKIDRIPDMHTTTYNYHPQKGTKTPLTSPHETNYDKMKDYNLPPRRKKRRDVRLKSQSWRPNKAAKELIKEGSEFKVKISLRNYSSTLRWGALGKIWDGQKIKIKKQTEQKIIIFISEIETGLAIYRST